MPANQIYTFISAVVITLRWCYYKRDINELQAVFQLLRRIYVFQLLRKYGGNTLIKVDVEGATGFLDGTALPLKESEKALKEMETLYESGWVSLPAAYGKELSSKIKETAKKIGEQSEALVVIGIGGSYLGARAAIEYIISPNYNALPKSTPDIYFAGNNASGEYLS